jgi:hypothetical protein
MHRIFVLHSNRIERSGLLMEFMWMGLSAECKSYEMFKSKSLSFLMPNRHLLTVSCTTARNIFQSKFIWHRKNYFL